MLSPSTIEVPVSTLKAGTPFSIEGLYFRLVKHTPSGSLVRPLDELGRVLSESYVISSGSEVVPHQSVDHLLLLER